MSLLTPDSGLLFWMIVSFGIVFVILSKYGFPVIIKAVEQRKAYIDNSLETARQANEQLANIQAEGARILAEAKEKQNAILKEAFAEKEQIIDEAHRKAAAETRLQVEEAARRIREEKENPRGPFRDCRPFDRHSREGDERKDQPRQGTTTNHRPAVG